MFLVYLQFFAQIHHLFFSTNSVRTNKPAISIYKKNGFKFLSEINFSTK